MMKKRASSQHLEMIISFLLFSSFIFFLLYFIPIKNKGDLTSSSLLILKNSFQNYTEREIIKMSIKTESNSCFSINLSEININEFSGVNVKNKEGKTVSSSIYGNTLIIDSNENYFEIIFSNDLGILEKSPCDIILLENYKIGRINKIKVLTNKSLYNFIENYNSNYIRLKEELNIPLSLEFAVKINDFDYDNKIPKDTEITAQTESYTVLYPNGEIENKEITFQIWS